MSALRNQVLHEVAQLDIKSLQLLQPILSALKQKTAHSVTKKRGVAASQCRKTLSSLEGSLGETILQEREDRF